MPRADRPRRARRAARPRRRRLPNGGEDARGGRTRAGAPSWWPTPPRASPRASRTARCVAALPHLVLDGGVLAAQAVGAEEVILCVPETIDLDAPQRAIAERRERDWRLARDPPRDGARALRRGSGVRAGQPPQRRSGAAHLHPADALRTGRGAAPDARQQRRDARPPRADRAPRLGAGFASSGPPRSLARRSSRSPARSPIRGCMRSSRAPR